MKISEFTIVTVVASDELPVNKGGTTRKVTAGDIADLKTWGNLAGKPATFPADAHVHPQAEVTNLVTDLAGKAANTHATAHKSGGGDIIRLDELGTPSDITTLNASLAAHGLLPKLPGGTTLFLRGDGTFTALPPSDPWTYGRVTGADFTTASTTAQNITGLSFTPAANTDYEFEAILILQTATTTVNPRIGLAWPTGVIDAVAFLQEAQTATGTPLFAAGNFNAALLVVVGGLPNITQSWPATVRGLVRAGSAPVGNVNVQLASETSGTTVRAQIGSFLRWRTVS